MVKQHQLVTEVFGRRL